MILWKVLALQIHAADENIRTLCTIAQPLQERCILPACDAGVCEVLTQCRVTLAPCSEMLLGIVLALAADQWAQVAQPCREFLASPGTSQTSLMTGLISKLTLGLADAAHGSEDAFLLHARRLSTAIQVSSLALHPALRATWSHGLLRQCANDAYS